MRFFRFAAIVTLLGIAFVQPSQGGAAEVAVDVGKVIVGAQPWRCVDGVTERDLVGIGGNVAAHVTCTVMTEQPGWICEIAGEGGEIVALVVYDNAGHVVRCGRTTARCLAKHPKLLPSFSAIRDYQAKELACGDRYNRCLLKKDWGWVQFGIDFASQARHVIVKTPVPALSLLSEWRIRSTEICKRRRDRCEATAGLDLEDDFALLKCEGRAQMCLSGVWSEILRKGPPEGVCKH
jgi:hypothetical protein